MPRRRPWFPVLLATLACTLLLADAPLAHADGLDDAETHAAAGRTAEARAALAGWFEAGPTEDDEALLRAAQLARRLPDIELLRTVRARAEAVEAAAGATTPALDLALGFAYLGLAEENLRLRTTSRSISLYFADALTRAEAVPTDGALGETAARLAAGVRFAQGDLPGAIAGLEAYRAATETTSPRLDALYGRLAYERGAAWPVTSSGHPMEEAQALLGTAVEALGAAAEATGGDALAPRQRRTARLYQAYAHHRLGQVAEADAAYAAAFGAEPRQAQLVVRGLQSLHAREPDKLRAALDALTAAHGEHVAILDALAAIAAAGGEAAQALVVAERRIAVAPEDPGSWTAAGAALAALGIPERAADMFAEALTRAPDHLPASFGMEQLARAALTTKPETTIALYERLIALRPSDPYTRNNYGFILRDLVSAHTDKGKGGIERIPADAPPEVRARLQRCVEVYAEAVAHIDPARDAELDEVTAWNLAGIVNDYGLMLHYFEDVQDAKLAERQYLRALRMTGYGFKDTYMPNMARLYRFVLDDVDHAWTWYRTAREAQFAILAESRDGEGRFALVPDEAKRQAAAKDVALARARILQVLELDAAEDGLPWPPSKENGNDR